MRKSLLMLFVVCSIAWGQTPLVFFDGEKLPDDAGFSRWGFTDNGKVTEENVGYTPGSSAIWWETSDWNWQGFEIWREAATDLSADWSENHLEFKVKAPAGINTLSVTLYDFNDNGISKTLEEYDGTYDGGWQHIIVPLDSLMAADDSTDFDESQVYWVKIEAAYENETIREALRFDDIWIGNPMLKRNIMVFNGYSLANDVSFGAWGFDNNDLILAEGEGYTSGSPAILWETSNWNWQGQGYSFNAQDLTYSWPTDSIKIKIKAPADINSLSLGLYDADGNAVWYELVAADIGFDGEWKSIEVALRDMALWWDEFDTARVTEVKLENVSDGVTVPERLLIDDIWVGSPQIPEVDIIPPNPPESISAYKDDAFPYVNFVTWPDVVGETGETYNVYASMDPITDLQGEGVIAIAVDVEEEAQTIAHYIYYPMNDGMLEYYYAVECKDSYGNVSETFTATASSFENTGKGKSIISLEVPENFTPDGDLSEWAHITPFEFKPSTNIFSGVFNDDADMTVSAYVAVDNDNIYVAIDVIDDYYTWAPDNTSDWWDDESIEFYIGLYEYKSPHSGLGSGAEPDYRMVFLPDSLWLPWDWSAYPNNSENYYFEDYGASDYVIEAKIPYYDMQWPGDSVYTVKEGAMIPFELFVADSDVKDGGNEGRLQLGDNPALNPWGDGQKSWGITWTGMPDFVVGVKEDTKLPMAYSLEQNYPNPFNPSTSIKYSIIETAPVKLEIYNALGQKVTELVNEVQSAGIYEIKFDAAVFASGVYFYSIKTGSFFSTKKMLLLK